ncbi:MFS transporter [Gulosibacter molinativorax]|uniref:MFS transporter n=2 Tax=Gulosibacter molinativorax TaxID=256821 RepID=A0ABT7C9S3_9MICO|nr:MFS transporter [Gulosibacter molinativorax]
MPGMPEVLALTVISFTGYSALLPVAPMWAVEGGADEVGAGLVNGVLLLVTILTQLSMPRLLRNFGWRWTLVSAALLLGLPAGALALNSDLWFVLLVSAIRGVGFGIITVGATSLIAQLVEPARQGKAIGAFGLAIAVPQVLFTPAGPWVAKTVGFETVFAIGTLPVLGAWLAWRLAGKAKAVPKTSGEPAPFRNLARPMVIMFGLTVCGGGILTFMPQMVALPTESLAALLLLTLTAALTRWLAGTLADTYGARRFLWPSIVITTVGMLLVGFAVREPEATNLVALLVGAVIVGVSYGALQTFTLSVSLQSVKPQHYNSASTVWNVGFDAGTGVGSVLVGAIAAGTSFSVAMYVGAALSLLTLPLAFGVRRA